MKKRILSLALALLLSLGSASVYAAGDAKAGSSPYQEAVDFLHSYGIFKGESSNNLAIESDIERYQMALFVARISTGWTDDAKWENTSANASEFTDIDEEAGSYLGAISYVSENGIIQGYGDGRFGPYDGITYQDALTMAARTLGYTGLAWPDGYIAKAGELSLTAGISGTGYTDVLTRGEVAQVIYNTMFAQKSSGGTLARDVFGIGATAADGEYPVKNLTINGIDISKYTISYDASLGGTIKRAATELQKYIKLTTGVKLPLDNQASAAQPRILITQTDFAVDDSSWEIFTDDAGLVLGCVPNRGSLYVVYHFLEEFLGWRFFASDTEVCYKADSIALADIDYEFVHNYKIRDMYEIDYFDTEISAKRYQNGDGKRNMNGWGGVVNYCHLGIHTFHRLNETEEVDQPCLNDPDVRARFVKNVRAYLDENYDTEEVRSIHVSQNDNQNYCQCEDCLADIEYYGTPAGSIIEMVNLIAEDLETYKDGKYSDVYVITFAYQYSLDCPSNIVCHPKVMVEYTIIDICHQHALTDPDCAGGTEVCPNYSIGVRSNAEVVEEMRKWAEICEHCYLYDYSANFRYYYSVFPTISNIYDNYKLLNEVGAWGYINLGYAQRGGANAEFGTLRDYLICKITEDPDMTEAEFETHLNQFLQAYYGNAWTYVKEYLEFTDNLTNEVGHCFGVNNSPEWIFGEHAFAAYSDWLVELFDKAMNAEGLTETQILHLRRLRISCEYLRLGAIYEEEINSSDQTRRSRMRAANNAFYKELVDLKMTYVDESTELPKSVNYGKNIRTWINHTWRHYYSE